MQVYFSFVYLIGVKKLFFLLLNAIILLSGMSPYLWEQKHHCRSQLQCPRADVWELIAAGLAQDWKEVMHQVLVCSH